MNKINIILKKIILRLASKNIIKMQDKKFIELKYEVQINKKLDLENPKTFNEKLQWLKLYDRNPEYTNMVDKYEAKKYVSKKIGEQYIIPTIGIYKKFEDINFNELPNKFVIKPTHTSGNVFICKDKDKINYKKLKKEINKWLKRKYFYIHREWPYKDVKPRIIIEKYMIDRSGSELKDYKFFCFNGKVKMILVCSNRFSNLNKTFFDEQWTMYNFTEGGHQKEEKIEKPNNFEKMKEIAEKLSNDISFVRIDFYEIDSKIYFGEITFYPSAGYEKFEPQEYDEFFGNMIKLPDKNI